MPSPFPGMDPYLEGLYWNTFRSQLLYQFARELSARLRPHYFARTEERPSRDERKLQNTLGIYCVPGRQLVTRIEILNPLNKEGAGREDYLLDRAKWLQSPVHLLEIDLLRAGNRSVHPLPAATYIILLSRALKRPWAEVWLIGLRDPLPTVPVPLLPEEPDLSLDLQLALSSVYDE